MNLFEATGEAGECYLNMMYTLLAYDMQCSTPDVAYVEWWGFRHGLTFTLKRLRLES